MVRPILSNISLHQFTMAGGALISLNGLVGIIIASVARRRRLKDSEAGVAGAQQNLKNAQTALWHGYLSFVMGLVLFVVLYFTGP